MRLMTTASWIGFSAAPIWMVEKFGWAMMQRPLQPAIALALTSGTTSGTSGSIRQYDVLSITIAPALAARGLCSADTLAPGELSTMSMPLKANFGRSWTFRTDLSADHVCLPTERA